MEPQSTPNTQMGAGQDRLDALSKQIIGCALTVMRAMGTGLLETSTGMSWWMSRVEPG
jgi:hypothetical protein